jgi:beta-glucosidase
LRALRAFTRVHLMPGASKPVTFELDSHALSYVNEAGERLVGAGSYVIAVGGGQPTTTAPKVTGSLRIAGQFRLEP